MRRVLPLLALLSLGFAPAPLPRPDRDKTRIDLKLFQGTWRVAGHHQWLDGAKKPSPWNITHVRVQNDQWTLLEANREVVTYRIEVHPQKKGGHIDWRGTMGEALWLGLIRRDGDSVEVIYLSANQRPGDFAAPPSGSMLIALQRRR